MSQLDLLAAVVAVLNRLGIPHMVVGSHAASLYGEPRTTHDVDMVIDLPPSQIDALVASLDPARHYLSPVALREGRMANVIDLATGDKVDLFLLKDDPAERTSLQRRRPGRLGNLTVDVASAEDVVLSKLRWSELSGGSERQEDDIRGILRRRTPAFDFIYLQSQVAGTGLEAALDRLMRQVSAETEPPPADETRPAD